MRERMAPGRPPRRRRDGPKNSDPTTLAGVVAWTYGLAMHYGVLRVDDSAVRAIEEAVQTAEGSSNDSH